MALLDEIKASMRISHSVLDSDFQNLISASQQDMKRVGITISTSATYSTADLIGRACELYVKAENDYQGKGEQFRANYEKLRDSLALDNDYQVTT